MRKLIVSAGIIASLLLYGCKKEEQKPAAHEAKKQTVEEIADKNTIKIATFNIQIFGKAKREKDDVVKILEEIVKNFDVVAIQEVRDITETTIPYFVERLNSSGKKFNYVISERLGRSQGKEQYAFIYNTNSVKFKGFSYVYKDINDVFEREPFTAEFESGKFTYALTNVHTKPDDATNEIGFLVDVIDDAKNKIAPNKDVIVLGDFNADEEYFSEATTTGLRDLKYIWLITDDFDTTVSSSRRTYDRIVITEPTKEDFTGKCDIVRFDDIFGLMKKDAKRVSDHYPAYCIFYTDKDTD
jgi:deoxyribonuclease-1-like protein